MTLMLSWRLLSWRLLSWRLLSWRLLSWRLLPWCLLWVALMPPTSAPMHTFCDPGRGLQPISHLAQSHQNRPRVDFYCMDVYDLFRSEVASYFRDFTRKQIAELQMTKLEIRKYLEYLRERTEWYEDSEDLEFYPPPANLMVNCAAWLQIFEPELEMDEEELTANFLDQVARSHVMQLSLNTAESDRRVERAAEFKDETESLATINVEANEVADLAFNVGTLFMYIGIAVLPICVASLLIYIVMKWIIPWALLMYLSQRESLRRSNLAHQADFQPRQRSQAFAEDRQPSAPEEHLEGMVIPPSAPPHRLADAPWPLPPGRGLANFSGYPDQPRETSQHNKRIPNKATMSPDQDGYQPCPPLHDPYKKTPIRSPNKLLQKNKGKRNVQKKSSSQLPRLQDVPVRENLYTVVQVQDHPMADILLHDPYESKVQERLSD